MDDDNLLNYQVWTSIYCKPSVVTINGKRLQFSNCQCNNWKKNKMPCKHEMVKYNGCQSLPEAYKTSPSFSSDNSVIFSTTDLPQHSEGDSHQGEQEESGQIKYSKYTEKNVPENIIGKNSGKNQLNKLPDPRFRLSKICRIEVNRNCNGNGRFSSKR